ncbi:plasmid mobilization protein [Runella limosa]|uniref:plasmid mobilization protein n=1 Tax=Runella limosa TaxID=370978 RepID=UPI00040DDE34|nr:plasmid mobilization relaxosome protein MobC [Runella limosa]
MEARKKGGRPPLGESKKTEEIVVSFTKKEMEVLAGKAAEVNMSIQDFLRELVAKGYVKNIDTPEQREIKRQLIALSNNVNQLAKLAHLNGLKIMQKQVSEVLDFIDELLKKYKK